MLKFTFLLLKPMITRNSEAGIQTRRPIWKSVLPRTIFTSFPRISFAYLIWSSIVPPDILNSLISGVFLGIPVTSFGWVYIITRISSASFIKSQFFFLFFFEMDIRLEISESNFSVHIYLYIYLSIYLKMPTQGYN